MEDKLQFDLKTSQKLFTLAARIDRFQGRWELLEKKDNRYLRELRSIASVQSIGSSTRIEGATLTDAEVEKLLREVEITSLETREQQEVVGYYEALELILVQYDFIDFTEANILTLHNQLLKFSEKDQHHRGKYKQFSNQVVASYPDGSKRVLFKTTEPKDTPIEMKRMIAWVQEHISGDNFHPLFVIGTAIYEFLSIHPFQDGNGRLSRLLTSLLLLRAGYVFVQYISLEHIVEEKKSGYYRALMNAQQHRATDKEVIQDWMFFFFQSLNSLIHKLERKYSNYLNIGGILNERQEKMLTFIRDRGVIKIGDAVQKFPEASLSTLKRDLSLLESESLIEKTGKGKSTAYRKI
ncbi:MAG: Fic family protein [Bacteroidia bacterium]|nr:Fic family protein [Bacteroidia bacterium]